MRKRILRLSWVGPLLLAACIIQNNTPESSLPSEHTASVTGRLVRGADLSLPAAAISVSLAGASSLLGQTAGDGTFTFTDVAAGSYVLRTSLVAAGGAAYPVAVTTVVVGKSEVQLGDVALPGALAGNVTLQGKSDHTGVDVFVPGTSWIAKSDADGRYVLSGVANGTHKLRFSKEGFEDAQVESVEAVSGEVTELESVELAIDGSGGSKLSGKIILTGRADSAGVTVHLEGTTKKAVTAADGTFAIEGIVAGQYAIHITAPSGWISGITLPNLPLMPGNPVQLPDLALGRGKVVFEGSPQAISEDGNHVVACDSNSDNAFLLNLVTKQTHPISPWCWDVFEAHSGETVFFVSDINFSYYRYDLASGAETVIFANANGGAQTLVRGDTAVLYTNGWDNDMQEWEYEYRRVGATGGAQTIRKSLESYPSGLLYILPDAKHVIVMEGSRQLDEDFNFAVTFAAMAISDGTLKTIGELDSTRLGEDAGGAYFFNWNRTSVVRLDFASLTTSVVSSLPAVNSSFFQEPPWFPYPIAFSAATGRFAYVGEDGLYAGSVLSDNAYKVAAFAEPVDCGNDYCEVGFFPGGESVVAWAGFQSYQGSILAPDAAPSPATMNLVGGTKAGSFAYFSADGLKIRVEGVDTHVAPLVWDATVKGNRLFYSQLIEIELTTPAYHVFKGYLVEYPIP